MTEQKILIVEDDDVLSEVITENLVHAEFIVIRAKNGKEGLSMALSEKPDLILLDVLMPVMDGLTMMDELRNKDHAYGKTVPVIFLTNLPPNEEKIMEAITKNEPAYYLIKSQWDLSQVVEKIKERLAKKI